MCTNKIRRLRLEAANRQNWKCHYCGLPLCDDVIKFVTAYGISKNQASKLLLTAEHVEARCDGGKDEGRNIVAAHRFCNINRHKRKNPKDASCYFDFVQKQIARKKWHPKPVLNAFDLLLRRTPRKSE